MHTLKRDEKGGGCPAHTYELDNEYEYEYTTSACLRGCARNLWQSLVHFLLVFGASFVALNGMDLPLSGIILRRWLLWQPIGGAVSSVRFEHVLQSKTLIERFGAS